MPVVNEQKSNPGWQGLGAVNPGKEKPPIETPTGGLR